MAKLSARGRTVKVEAVKEVTREQLQASHDRRYPDKTTVGELALTIWERRTHRLMSDGKVLEKLDVQFQPDRLDQAGRKHSYGWKVHGTLKAGLTADDFARIYSKPRKDGSPSRWTVTTTGLSSVRTVVISQARIMRAVESGESIGFCQSCGNDQHGCEPDARGYTCESCGKPEVYSAEELLMMGA